MKKIICLVLALLMCVSVAAFAGCQSKKAAGNTSAEGETANTSVNADAGKTTDADKTADAGKSTDAKKTTDAKKIVIGLDDAFPPMGFRDDKNEIVGFDVDFAREAFTRMGYTDIVFQPIDWANKILELNSGKVDVLWNGFTITDERKEQVLFTKPYLTNAQVIVVAASSDIKEKANLEGKKVSAQVDSAGLEALNADDISKKVSEIVEFPDYVAAFNDLKVGRVDAVVVDLVVADYYLSKNKGTFKVLGEALSPEEYGVGIKKGNEALLNNLQKTMDAMIKDGKAAEISKKWFGIDRVLK